MNVIWMKNIFSTACSRRLCRPTPGKTNINSIPPLEHTNVFKDIDYCFELTKSENKSTI